MSFLINALTAVFGKPKYDSGGVTVFTPEDRAQHTAAVGPSYHWREKENCVACDKRRVTMTIPQLEDFGFHETMQICASCANEMYGLSRYLFNDIIKEKVLYDEEELPW